MKKLETMEVGKREFYSNQYYSGNYDHEIYLKKAISNPNEPSKYYISIFTKQNNILILQGYIYFYIDEKTKTSSFIGLKVNEEYRNLNIGSLLLASWIDLCLNNNYKTLKMHKTQRKPFLLYLLKTYGFEIEDLSLYQTRKDVIIICKKERIKDKLLYFKDYQHELAFLKTNIYQTDNYKIIHDLDEVTCLDKIILPLQNRSKINIDYQFREEKGLEKASLVLSRHRK